jgi:hypothetical protein
MPVRNNRLEMHSMISGRLVFRVEKLCRRLTLGTSRWTCSLAVRKVIRYRIAPATTNAPVVMVSERCRSSEPLSCGATTKASIRMVRLEP